MKAGVKTENQNVSIPGKCYLGFKFSFYYPTLLPRKQISRETSTNNRYLYSPHSSRPREAQNLSKSEFWEKKSLDNKSGLLDVLVCSIAVYFYSLFVF